MNALGNDPFFFRVGNGDAFSVAFAKMCCLIPDDFPDVYAVFENFHHAGTAEPIGPARPGAHGVDRFGDHLAAGAFLNVHLKHQAHDSRFVLPDAQGWLFVSVGFFVAVGSVGNVSAVFDGALGTGLQAALDHFQLLPGKKGFELGVILVGVVIQINCFCRRHNLGAAGFERFQNDALLRHGAAAQAVDIHAQHGVERLRLHILQQPQHFGSGVQRVAGNNLLVNVLLRDRQRVLFREFQEGFPVALQGFLHRLVGVVRARFAQVNGYVRDAAPPFPWLPGFPVRPGSYV